MNLHQLRVFYETARAESFSAAAEKLNISQPAVTWQIKNLEESFDLRFFERTGKRILLTQEGRILFGFIEQILALARQAEDCLADFRNVSRGTLRIDSVFTFAVYYLPSLLENFHREHPKILVQVNTGNESQIIENTLNHRNDLAFVAYHPQDERLRVEEMTSDVLVGVVAPSHPLAKKKTIDLKELKEQPLILREPKSSPRRLMDEVFRRAGIQPRIILESASAAATKKMVEGKMGIAILSQQVIKEELRAGRLKKLAIRDAQIVYRYYLIYRQNRHLSRTIQAFIDIARGASGKFRRD